MEDTLAFEFKTEGEGINVLSLFDGMSCGQLALQKLGIKVRNYFASEIDKHAIKVTQSNFPETIQLGDVTKIDTASLPKIDLLIGGSPCQSLSIVQSKTRQHLDGKSKLFFYYIDIKNSVTPTFFLFENVASMNDESKDAISLQFGSKPIFINSSYFSAQERPRLYWTNINVSLDFSKNDCVLKDILENQVDNKYFYDYPLKNVDLDKQVCAIMDYKNHDMHKRIFNPDFKCHTLTTCGGGNTQKKVYVNGRARKLTEIEYERLQTVPDNYTKHVSSTHRYTMLGNGWTVDVIAHILSFMRVGVLNSNTQLQTSLWNTEL